MDRDGIKQVIPHREPMLLIDTAELIDGASVASYTVRGDEFFLQGHYPGNPVVPGVILCEMMAQSACLLTDTQGATPYLTGITNARFKKPVKPGDTINFKCELKSSKDIFRFIKGEGRVDGNVCVNGELSFALVE